MINDPLVASANVLAAKHLLVPAPPLGCLVGGKVLELAAVILGHVMEVLLIEESLVEDITLIEHVHTDIVVVVVVVVGCGCGTVEDHCEEEKNERQREKLHGLFCCWVCFGFDCVCVFELCAVKQEGRRAETETGKEQDQREWVLLLCLSCLVCFVWTCLVRVVPSSCCLFGKEQSMGVGG